MSDRPARRRLLIALLILMPMLTCKLATRSLTSTASQVSPAALESTTASQRKVQPRDPLAGSGSALHGELAITTVGVETGTISATDHGESLPGAGDEVEPVAASSIAIPSPTPPATMDPSPRLDTAEAAPTVAQDQALSAIVGQWQGAYHYGDPSQGVAFDITIARDADHFTGVCVEPATFGDGTSKVLRATLRGSVSADGRTVEFRKTYDGTGGVSHSIDYRGTLESGARITGLWSDCGPFSMELLPRAVN